jgi:V/A-type H+-transporting ATPase subunit C
MLGDTDYGKGYQDEIAIISGPSADVVNIEQVLKQEAERVRKFISELTQDREQTDILFSRYDFFNLKLSLKGIFGNTPVEDFFLPLGTLPPALIYQEVKEADKTEILPPHLKEAAIQAVKAYGDTKSSMEIDRVVDASMYRYMLTRTRDKELFFLFRLLTTEIDLTNIITFFRLKWVGESLPTLQAALIEGGRIPFASYYEFFPREIDDIETGLLSDEVYHDFIAEGVNYLKIENSFIRMESLVDRELMKIISREKEINFGVEILIAYFYKKSIEMKKLRTVIIGKENGLSPDEIKARLGYVG